MRLFEQGGSFNRIFWREGLLERGLKTDHSTLNRWVIDYSKLLEEKFRKKYKIPVGSSWRMDETYVKIKGEWNYLYRAVDKDRNTIDFMLSKNASREIEFKNACV